MNVLTIERTASLRQAERKIFVQLDLGPVALSQKAEIIVTLENDTDDQIDIEGITTTCTCTSAKTKDRQIKAGESGKLFIEFEAKDSASRPDDSFKVLVERQNNIPIQIVATYQIRGFFKFDHARSTAEVRFDAKKVEIGLPFRFTEPITLERLKVDSPFLEEDWNAVPGKEQGTGILKLTLENQEIAAASRMNRINVLCEGTDFQCETILELLEWRGLKLLPSTLFFKLGENDDRLVAHCIVVVSEEAPTNEEENSKETKLAVDARLGDKSVRVVTDRLPHKRFRVQLDVPKLVLKETDAKQVTLNVVASSASQVFEVPFVIPRK